MTIDGLQHFWGSKAPAHVLKKLALHLFLGIILGTLGPYDSSNLPSIALRFAYWISLLLFGGFISGPIARAFFPAFKQKSQNVKLAFLSFCAVISVPINIAILVVDVLFVHIILGADGPMSFSTALATLASMPFGILGYVLLYGQVWLVSVIAFGTTVLLAGNHEGGILANPVEKPVGYDFLNRLPADLGGNLLCLSMEDHYVRAHTAAGDTMVLMRLADAVKELKNYPGMQIHRSWWIAYAAIQKVSKEKRRYFVHLKNGMKAPVSQTYAQALKEQGYI